MRAINLTLAGLALAALSSGVTAQAQTQSDAAMAQAFASGKCSFAPPWEPGRWRLVTPADYSGENWQAWRTQTKQSHPGLARGDFNGDGQPDTAVVGLRDDGKWSVGVIHGSSQPGQCDTNSVSEASPTGMGKPPALVALPKAAKGVVCQQAGLRYPATCVVAASAKPAWKSARPTDAFIQTDEHATAFNGYLYQQWSNHTKPDGSPLMVYGELPIEAQVVPSGR